MLELAIKFLGAYLIGNVMGGQVVGRLRGGIDLAKLGSGNIGATNALRTQGKLFALAVLLIDVFKGVCAVLFVPAVAWEWAGAAHWPREWQAYLCGVAVTLGHCYPFFYRFTGGKGVATLAGVFGTLLTPALPWLLLAFALTVMLTGYASLATLSACTTALLYIGFVDVRGFASAAGVFTIAMSALVAWKHRANIRRLLRGEESRFERARVLRRWRKR